MKNKSVETMIMIVRYEYEKEELRKYKPLKFETYLLYKLAELRVNTKKLKP